MYCLLSFLICKKYQLETENWKKTIAFAGEKIIIDRGIVEIKLECIYIVHLENRDGEEQPTRRGRVAFSTFSHHCRWGGMHVFIRISIVASVHWTEDTKTWRAPTKLAQTHWWRGPTQACHHGESPHTQIARPTATIRAPTPIPQ